MLHDASCQCPLPVAGRAANLKKLKLLHRQYGSVHSDWQQRCPCQWRKRRRRVPVPVMVAVAANASASGVPLALGVTLVPVPV